MSIVLETVSLKCNEEKDNEFADDSEYDPILDAEQEKAVYDFDEELDIINDSELENDIQEEALIDINSEDEENIINSQYFESELLSAMESVEKKAKIDGSKILTIAREQYMNNTGMEVTDSMIQDALKIFNDNLGSTQDTESTDDIDDIQHVDDEQDIDDDVDQQYDVNDDSDDIDDDEEDEDVNDVDPELFAKEMDDALDTVRKLAAFHQCKLINTICDTFTELNGIQPTTEEIGAIFGGIKEGLTDEARDDFIEVNDAEDDDDDSDYNPIDDAMQQIETLEDEVQENDNNDDIEIDEDVENEDNVENNVNDKIDNKKVDISVNSEITSKFKEINVGGVDDDNKEDQDEDEEEEEEDEDYTPTKDKYDYSRDIEDDLKSEESVDENINNSNIIDID